jgi:beta-glucosidase
MNQFPATFAFLMADHDSFVEGKHHSRFRADADLVELDGTDQIPRLLRRTMTNFEARLCGINVQTLRADVLALQRRACNTSSKTRQPNLMKNSCSLPSPRKRTRVLGLMCALLASIPAWPQQSEQPDSKNTTLSFEERARDLVSRMTLEEKISQLGHTSDAVPRMGIPEYNWWNEGLHGVARAGVATVFPQAIGLAATFDQDLIHRDAEAISTEFRAKYNVSRGKDGSSDWYKGLTVWSPNINIFRDPRWGRGQETYGEDPFLTARMGTAFVEGLQGDDPHYLKVIATPKHFAVHSGPEATRHEVNVTVSKHDLEETYLPAFRAVVTSAKADSVMCAYNAVDGDPACANDMLLGQYLRGDWKFGGYVVSDCGAVTDISEHHHFKPTMEEGVTAALKAGTDLFCGSPQERVRREKTAVLNAVHQGILSEADVDRAVVRLMTARFRLGMFDPPTMVPWSRLGTSANDTPAHRELALKTAQESIVLLKNEKHLLPLKKLYSRIAVIGPDADSLDALEGNYNGTPSAPVTILSGIRRRFKRSKSEYVQGTGLTGTAVRPVPATALYTTSAKSARGLQAEYFDNTELKGSPVLRRTDASVNFTWAFNGISSRLKTNYSVRWSGVLVSAETSDYLVGFTGQDGYRVWVDGQLLVEDWTTHRPSTTVTAPLHLEANRAYAIRIEYFQTIRSAEAKLVWGIPGREEELAEKAAKRSDLVVMALGLSARIEGEEMKVKAEGFSGGDRTSLDLPAAQEQLLERICAVGKPVVLVLTSGSALSVNWADAHVPAIIEAWYPGENGGAAVAEVLAGDVSPSGRLPVTFYKSVDHLPAFDDYSMTNRTYRYFEGEVLYPFGYGLSYSNFQYSNPRVSEGNASGKLEETVSVDVTNTGTMAADEVVELYLTHEGVPGAPMRELKGFHRVHLARGEKRSVAFALEERDLSSVDEAGQRRLMPGDVSVWIGGGQPIQSPRLAKPNGVATSFKITKGETLPE